MYLDTNKTKHIQYSKSSLKVEIYYDKCLCNLKKIAKKEDSC